MGNYPYPRNYVQWTVSGKEYQIFPRSVSDFINHIAWQDPSPGQHNKNSKILGVVLFFLSSSTFLHTNFICFILPVLIFSVVVCFICACYYNWISQL